MFLAAEVKREDGLFMAAQRTAERLLP